MQREVVTTNVAKVAKDLPQYRTKSPKWHLSFYKMMPEKIFNISKLSCQMFYSRRPDDYQTAHWNSYVRHIQLAISTLEQLQKT
jgi:hypothetical protein